MRRIFHTCLLIALTGCQRAPERASVPLTREAYVWQQVASPALEEAVRGALPALDSLSFHAADIRFTESGVRAQEFPVSWPVLAKDGRPVSLVVRIYARTLDGSEEQVDAVRDVIRSLRSTAQKAGLACREVQLDYDCADSKLSLYADFLRGLRKAVPETPLPITVLPSWLDQPAFRPLAEAASEYILQVHSLHTPRPDDQSITLFEATAAQRAIDRASALGSPFRLALPTYRSTVIMEKLGKRGPAYSENRPPPLEPGQRYVSGTAELAEIAPFVARLLKQPPAHLTGLIWYRLPVATDRMNWPWSTFQLVSTGVIPKSQLTTALDVRPEGFSTILVRNTGEQPEKAPERIRVSYLGSISADGLAGYALERDKDTLIFSAPHHTPPTILQPGAQLTIGWLRSPQTEGIKIFLE